MIRIETRRGDNISVAQVDTTYENAINFLIRETGGSVVSIEPDSCTIYSGTWHFTITKVKESSYS